ncbi:putative class III aminotransferase, partial [Colletotrichum asianum]
MKNSVHMNGKKPNHSLLYKHFEKNPALVITSGKGIYLETEDGRKILDATSGAAVSCLGFDNQQVKLAVIEQLLNIPYCHPGFYQTKVAEELASLLVQSTHEHMGKAILCGSGSEAMEVTMKLAKTHFTHLAIPEPERTRFIARVRSYHGATLGTLALGDWKPRKDPFNSIVPQITTHVSACSTYRGLRHGETEEAYVERLAQELDDEFQRVGPEKVCAFVAETVGGSASGCATPVPGYFRAMKAVCQKYGALLILDEIMCGMGRTGSLHAWEQEGVAPDIQAVGKGLDAGYGAISAVLVNSDLVSSFKRAGKPFPHGQAYMAYPLAVAAALKTQQIIREHNLISNVVKMGKYLEQQLKERVLHLPFVGDIRGRGLFWAVEFVSEKTTKASFPPDLDVNNLLHAKGLEPGYDISLFHAGGTHDGYAGDHFLICPPYIVTESDIDEIVNRTIRVVKDTFTDLSQTALWKKLSLKPWR